MKFKNFEIFLKTFFFKKKHDNNNNSNTGPGFEPASPTYKAAFFIASLINLPVPLIFANSSTTVVDAFFFVVDDRWATTFFLISFAYTQRLLLVLHHNFDFCWPFETFFVEHVLFHALDRVNSRQGQLQRAHCALYNNKNFYLMSQN